MYGALSIVMRLIILIELSDKGPCVETVSGKNRLRGDLENFIFEALCLFCFLSKSREKQGRMYANIAKIQKCYCT